MDNKKTIILIFLIIVGIVFLGVGYLGGVLLEKQKVAPQLEQLKKTTETIKELSSKTIASITVVGEVTNISGRILTITNITESIDISIREDAQIFSLVGFTGKNVTSQNNIDFGSIKKGDNLNVQTKVLASGELEGVMVVVLPSVAPKTP